MSRFQNILYIHICNNNHVTCILAGFIVQLPRMFLIWRRLKLDSPMYLDRPRPTHPSIALGKELKTEHGCRFNGGKLTMIHVTKISINCMLRHKFKL